MLPEIRKDGYLYCVPDFESEKKHAEEFAEELKAFHGGFSDCFSGSGSGKHFFSYMRGQFGGPGRKSAEPIAVSVS